MRTEEKTSVRNSVGRLLFAGICVILQIVWLILLAVWLNQYSAWISLAISLLALVIVLRMNANTVISAFKLPWIILILVFPVAGIALYFITTHTRVKKSMQERYKAIDDQLKPLLCQDEKIMKCLQDRDYGIANQFRYLWNFAHAPVYRNTDVVFYPLAEKGIQAQKEAMEQAQSFIFMEYHAIEDAESFRSIQEILARKAKEGVQVRLLYDDVGSIGFINTDFIKRMEKSGIHCKVFNRVMPILNIFMNNRDHRKITVIDGKVGFTGGYNIANEYFNVTHPYGHWKDTGIKLSGDAVRSLTTTFLEMWNAVEKTDIDYESYLPQITEQAIEHGFVAPYADSPLDDEYVGENVYMNLVKNAKHYIYFTTPYLIISDEMRRELGLAAKRGVNVRIVTPGIPDKKMIYKVTRSYYSELTKNGVQIYEYTPGFLHAKQCVCDGETATVGTINMDYRSLYHHFENGVYLYHCQAVREIYKDFTQLFLVSKDVTGEYNEKSPVIRGTQSLLRLIAPLL